VLELLQLPLACWPDSALDRDHWRHRIDEAEAVVGPVIIATMLLPYLVPPLLVF
jgi:hypothetical protein